MNRREALGCTAATAVAMAFAPARVLAQAAGVSPVMTTLSAYMSAAANRALPDDVAEHAKHHLLDTLAAMISGSELAPGQAAARYIGAHGGKGTSTVVAARLTASAQDAALANGVMAHADETDDSHNASRSHPGCSVVPAALAAGEEFGVDGAHLLRAVTLGYDIGTRVVLAMGGADFSYEQPGHAQHRRNVRRVGRGRLRRRPRCTADALGARLRRAAILGHHHLAARHRPHREGVRLRRHAGAQRRHAALLVQTGWNGVDDMFSGPDNFFLAYAPKAQARAADRQARRTLRDRADRHQEMDRRFADPGAARRHRGDPQQAAVRGRSGAASDGAGGAFGSRGRGQSRHAGHLPAAHGRRDAARQDGLVPCRSRQAADAGRGHLRQRAKVELVRDEELAKLLPVRVTIVEIDLTDGTPSVGAHYCSARHAAQTQCRAPK